MVSRAERLEKEAELLRAQDAFVAAKAAGQKKRDAALAKAFAAAKTHAEYEAAKA